MVLSPPPPLPAVVVEFPPEPAEPVVLVAWLGLDPELSEHAAKIANRDTQKIGSVLTPMVLTAPVGRNLDPLIPNIPAAAIHFQTFWNKIIVEQIIGTKIPRPKTSTLHGRYVRIAPGSRNFFRKC
jgi:hypothetical protein